MRRIIINRNQLDQRHKTRGKNTNYCNTTKSYSNDTNVMIVLIVKMEDINMQYVLKVIVNKINK